MVSTHFLSRHNIGMLSTATALFSFASPTALFSTLIFATHGHAFAAPGAFTKPSNHPYTSTATTKKSTSLSSQCLPDDYPNLNLITPALAAIRKAAKITTCLQPTTSLSKISGITKTDTSPVTIGDFAAQAIVLNLLDKELEEGEDVFIAEESSQNLDEDLSLEILRVFQQVGLNGIIDNEEDLKRSIDLGQTYGSNGQLNDSVRKRMQEPGLTTRVWCLDPIDGTRGFLRGKQDGGQYCIALALIEDGVPIMGILGCPNLPTDAGDENYAWGDDETGTERGCIFVASRGGGCYQLPLYAASGDDGDTTGAQKVQVTGNDGGADSLSLEEARFCIGVEKYGDPEGKVTAIAKKIHGRLDDDGDILFTRRMDSQVKYGVVARGGSEFITRLPKKEYHEWIWDHACGKIIIEEAGGMQTDTDGNLIDYGLGAKMDKDVDGILISAGGVYHEAILNAYKEQEAERPSST